MFRVRRSKLGENSSHLHVGYSPNLDPDEMFNQNYEIQRRSHKAPSHTPQMMDNVRSHFHARQRQKAVVSRFFQAPSVRCATFKSCQPFYAHRNNSGRFHSFKVLHDGKKALSIALKPTATISGFLRYQIVDGHLQVDKPASIRGTKKGPLPPLNSGLR